MDQDEHNSSGTPAAIVPRVEKLVSFYGDQVPAAQTDEGEIYVPLRPLTTFLGLSFGSQRNRIMRDELLAPRLRSVLWRAADGKRYEMLSLPLDLLPGWLFGITASRVKAELQEKIRLYRAECFRVLWDAFKGDVAPGTAATSTLSGAELAREIGIAITRLAEQQIELERRVSDVAGRHDAMADFMRGFVVDTRHQLQDHGERLTGLELQLSAGAAVSPAQAAEIALAVKNVGQQLAVKGDRQGYAKVYSELYRRYGISSYKNLPAARYDEVLAWLRSWYGELAGDGQQKE